MTARGEKGPRLPLGAGQHVMLVGATGAGKTTTAQTADRHPHPGTGRGRADP